MEKAEIEKCAYCGKPGKEKGKFCSDECKRRYEKELQKDQRNIRYFLLGIGIGILCLFAGAIIGRKWAEGGGLILTGLTIFIFPFTTPEAVKWLGYKRAKVLGRTLGILVIAAGGWILIGID